MKTLIIYGTTEGQTKKISEFIYHELITSGHEAEVIEANKVDQDINMYDVIVIAASMHIGRYQKSVRRFIKNNCHILNKKITAFVSVSLTAASNDATELAYLKSITKRFLEKLNWQPIHTIQVAGALRYSKYNFFKKLLMKQIAKKNTGNADTSKDYEFTDWNQVKEFVYSVLLKEYALEA